MALRGLWIALAAWMLVLGTTSIARAAPLVCIVRVDRPVDDALWKRILGQTSDLPLTIVRVPESIEPEIEAAKARAAVLARSHGARAVVWFMAAASGEISIFVEDPEARRLFVHHVGQEAGSPSAMLEASSLIVRDVLQSLLEGEPIGRPMESPPRDSSDALAPPPVLGTEPARPARVVMVTREPPRAWTPFTAAGARAVLSHARPSTAVSYRLGLVRGSVEAGVALTLGVTDVWSDPIAALLVRRHVLGAFGGWRWKLGDELTATVDLHAGVALFMRSTRPRASFLSASASRVNAYGYVGPEARITWGPWRSWARVSVGAGADVVFAPPAFSYEGAGGRVLREVALWPVQPHFNASLEIDLRTVSVEAIGPTAVLGEEIVTAR